MIRLGSDVFFGALPHDPEPRPVPDHHRFRLDRIYPGLLRDAEVAQYPAQDGVDFLHGGSIARHAATAESL